jgi:hypothetical protein
MSGVLPKPGDTITLFGVTYTAREVAHVNPAYRGKPPKTMIWDGGLRGGQIIHRGPPDYGHPFYTGSIHYKTLEKAAQAAQGSALYKYERAKDYVARWEAPP